MAEESGQEKISPPSDYRLREARRRGDVVKSDELTQAFLFLTAWGLLAAGGEYYFSRFRQLLLDFLKPELLRGDLPDSRLFEQALQAWLNLGLLTLPFLLVVCAVSLGISLMQVRPLFSFEPLKPAWQKLNPIEGVRNLLFTGKVWRDLALNLVRFAVILLIVYLNVKNALRDLTLAARLGVPHSAQLAAALLSRLVLQAGLWFILTGAADSLLRRHDYLRKLSMTRKEVEDEQKQFEASPETRQRQREFRDELLDIGGLENVPAATFVAVNPTHLAIAIGYREGEVPKVIAKGRGLSARQMMCLAHQHKVPVLRRIQLARSLFLVPLGQEVPKELWQAVAIIIRELTALSRR